MESSSNNDNRVFIARKTNRDFLLKELLIPILKSDFTSIVLNYSVILDAMRQDKKNIGHKLALIMLTDGYQMEKITDLEESEVIQSLEYFTNLQRNERS